jgi:hypothetical protein
MENKSAFVSSRIPINFKNLQMLIINLETKFFFSPATTTSRIPKAHDNDCY